MALGRSRARLCAAPFNPPSRAVHWGGQDREHEGARGEAARHQRTCAQANTQMVAAHLGGASWRRRTSRSRALGEHDARHVKRTRQALSNGRTGQVRGSRRRNKASAADGRRLARRTVLLFDDPLDLCLYIPLAKVTDQAGNLSCLIAEHDRAHGCGPQLLWIG